MVYASMEMKMTPFLYVYVAIDSYIEYTCNVLHGNEFCLFLSSSFQKEEASTIYRLQKEIHTNGDCKHVHMTPYVT